MINKTFFIFFLVFSLNSFSQNNFDFIKINYKSFLLDEREEYGCFLYEETTLLTSNLKSYYYEKARDTIIQTISMGDMDNTSATYNFTYFKDFSTKKIYFNRDYGLKKVIVDSINIIKWDITKNYTKVMGYDCQEAKCVFRGRSYKAYFLKDIPIPNGPFKFDGLPGLILKVQSDDGTVNIEAYEIEYNKDIKFNFTNPFDEKNIATWQEFKDFYKKRVEKVKNYNPEDGMSFSIPIGYIEKFVD
ncbi:GLPGLI family protein [Flavobacterium buctense]|uniref:GLPGLI family protein n=1 Tax=Flavobacterium buctense TaxID=1648146 RepID=A0ABU9E023_9FLAO|nr:GLPGLI family protein [Flavobacterium buctense]